MSDPAPALSVDDRRALLVHARRSIAAHLEGQPPPDAGSAVPSSPGAAFVTLRERGALRGCIGTVSRALPLALVVHDMAVAAATRDPRFAPLTRPELDGVTIELSVLTEPERITGAEEVEIGRHGVAIAHHGRRGLLLPQVAVEEDWTATTLLRQLCRKAGLPPDAWQDPAAMLERFTADIFTDRAR